MAANNLRNSINSLDFLSNKELVELVKCIVGNHLGLDDRIKIESWMLSEINNDESEDFNLTDKKDHVAKVLGWDDYDHVYRNRDRIPESTLKAFYWIVSVLK